MPDLDTLAAAEDDVAAAVRQALDDVAAEFADSLDQATELVAARVSVSRIARMWAERVPALIRRLLGVAEAAARATAEDVDAPGELPDQWDDLPGRHDDGQPLPDSLGDYVTTTEQLLTAVGDRLADVAVRELARGVDAGEDLGQLRARLREAFAREGAQLGDAREDRIARTEATRAWNTATLAAGRDLTGPDRPLVKQWIALRDSAVREAHADVNGQLRLIDEPFTVAGVSMSAPGDPTAPPALTINCRCIIALAHADRTAATPPHAFDSQGPSPAEIDNPMENDVVTHQTAAAGGPYTGAMIALLPSEADAERLALTAPGAESTDQLHLTLYYLGEGADWDAEHRADLITRLRDRAHDLAPVHARAFGANHWNADGDDPCWVWAIGDDRDRPDGSPTLETARYAALYALEDMHRQPELPEQYTPWAGHVCAAYSASPALLPDLEARLGPITFDRLRIAFAGQYTDIPLRVAESEAPMELTTAVITDALPTRSWSTPGDTAIAFEGQETGDGRIFAAESLYWEGGPWPLQYADEMLMGHQGAELAGSIQAMGRDEGRITATGVLYPGRPAGADAAQLLDEDAPLGVSVDLDDVDVEFVDRTDTEETGLVLAASLPSASVLRLDDGSLVITATTTPEWTASGIAMSRTQHAIQFITGPGGTITAAALRAAFAGTSVLTAAAGDPDDPDAGTVVRSENSGDLLIRITRGRIRGATLVAMPAYDRARIVLDPIDGQEQGQPRPLAPAATAASGPTSDHWRVVEYVATSPLPVGAREVAQALGMRMETARGHLARAAVAGRIVRLARGQYIGAPDLPEGPDVAAAMSGDTDLPIHPDREHEWDGDAAASRVLDWATSSDGDVDASRLGAAFLYRDPDADPATLAAYKLGMADVFDGELHIVPRAVFAIASVLQGGRGGVDIPADEQEQIRDRVEDLYERMAEEFDDPSLRAPWDAEQDASRLAAHFDLVEAQVRLASQLPPAAGKRISASFWRELQDLPPMPAEWFREPTPEELPSDAGGVFVKGGRIWGWVAQAGVPHRGYPGKKLTIESLGKLDLTEFLKARFQLDNGATVRVGPLTMNVGHHRDGWQCETAACQFDDSGTVGGIVTVGVNDRGMWFAGAANPKLGGWDKAVFLACQPSYHMSPERNGRWKLQAVLDVPVPGHPSRMAPSRSDMDLAASAAPTAAAPGTRDPDTESPPEPAAADEPGALVTALATDPDLVRVLASAFTTAVATDDAVVDALADAVARREAERAEAARAEVARLALAVAPVREEIAASARL